MNDSADADDEPVSVPLSAWDDVVEQLRRFGDPGEVTVDDDVVTVRVGSSHVTVHRDGRVDTGMPQHGFEKADVSTLQFDHEAGVLRIEDDDERYEFRRPR